MLLSTKLFMVFFLFSFFIILIWFFKESRWRKSYAWKRKLQNIRFFIYVHVSSWNFCENSIRKKRDFILSFSYIYIYFFITKLLFPYYICQTKRGVYLEPQSFFLKEEKIMLLSQRTLQNGIILRDVDDEEDLVNSISLKDILGKSESLDSLYYWDKRHNWIDID